MTENDDEYYENMIRAEKRVDPKEEIAELKKRNKAIYEVLHTARRYLLDEHLHEARVLDEVCKLLIDLNENPEVEGYGKQLADNIVARVKVVPPEDPNQTQLLDWEQRQSQERARQRPILGNRILTPVRDLVGEEPPSNPNASPGFFGQFTAAYNDQHNNDPYNNRNNPYSRPGLFGTQRSSQVSPENLARAQRLQEGRAQVIEYHRDRNAFVESHMDIVEGIVNGTIDIMDLRGTRYTGQQINWLATAVTQMRARTSGAPAALSDSPLNDAARENQARMERTCRFGGVDCEHEATVMNEHGTPMCDPCSERDFQARGSDFNYEILPYTPSPHPTR